MNHLDFGMWFHLYSNRIRVGCVTDILEVMEACLHRLARQRISGVDRNGSHAVRPKGL